VWIDRTALDAASDGSRLGLSRILPDHLGDANHREDRDELRQQFEEVFGVARATLCGTPFVILVIAAIVDVRRDRVHNRELRGSVGYGGRPTNFRRIRARPTPDRSRTLDPESWVFQLWRGTRCQCTGHSQRAAKQRLPLRQSSSPPKLNAILRRSGREDHGELQHLVFFEDGAPGPVAQAIRRLRHYCSMFICSYGASLTALQLFWGARLPRRRASLSRSRRTFDKTVNGLRRRRSSRGRTGTCLRRHASLTSIGKGSSSNS